MVPGPQGENIAAPKLVWVGLLEIRPLPGNESLKGRFGAYVHVLAPADTWEEFAEAARQFLEADGWEAIEADMKPAVQEDLSEKLWTIAQSVAETQLPARDDTLFTYPEDDETDDE